LIVDGKNYLAGLDSVTSYDISTWLDNHITNYNLDQGGTDVNRVFTDANGKDLSELVTTNAYTKSELKELIAVEVKKILGAQSMKSSN